MTNGHRCHTNKRLRVVLDTHVQDIPVGTQFLAADIARLKDTNLISVNAMNVGNFLSERDDVRKVSRGIWERVTG